MDNIKDSVKDRTRAVDDCSEIHEYMTILTAWTQFSKGLNCIEKGDIAEAHPFVYPEIVSAYSQ